MGNMERELLIISPYDQMIHSIRAVCKELNISPAILEWERATRRLIQKLKRQFAVNGHPDVIVSRGALAGMMERHFRNIVIVRAEPDDLDITEGIARVRGHGRKIGFLIYAEHAYAYKAEVLRSLLDLDVLRPYPFRTRRDIEMQIAQGMRDGMDAMLGGGTLGQRTGKALGFPVLFVETGRRSLRNAVLQAMAIVEARSGEKRQIHSLATVVASVQEGIMTVKDGRIGLVNQELAAMLGIAAAPSGQPVNMLSVSDLDPRVQRFIEHDPLSEDILPIGNQTVLVKKVPLSRNKDRGETMLIFRNVTEIQKQEQKIRRALHAKGLTARYRFEDILGHSPAFRAQIDKARTFAATNASVLIHGESGTGKELFAQSIHNASSRKNRPFVAVNCAAIPESLLESELFGYEEGAFSGARRSGKAGLFELAHEGTIFLDEINSLPIALQGVLLRVIQEKEIRRVGAQNVIAVDIRVISATNCDIELLIDSNAFRSDLYYRLNTLNLSLPPLAARKEDILPLADHFLNLFTARYAIASLAFSVEDRAFMTAAPWTGNVRELENVVHRFVILNKEPGEEKSVRHCIDGIVRRAPSPPGKIREGNQEVCRGTLEAIEREIILRYMEECRWNKQEAAERLGICRTTLWRKLRKIPGFDTA